MTAPLTSYDDALARMLAAARAPVAVTMPLSDAAGFALAETLFACENLPPWDNSAVDGYAVHGSDTVAATPDAPVLLPVSQIIRAGENPDVSLPAGTAARIFTGAPLPPGADALVMQEDTETVGMSVKLFAPGESRFVRRAGSDVSISDVLARQGDSLDVGLAGLLAAQGFADIPVFRLPRIAILTNGDEIVPVGTPILAPGKIRNANASILRHAARELTPPTTPIHVADDPDAVRAALKSAAQWADIIVTSGGVSVGEHDYITDAVRDLGTLDFWRVAIKPGKPLAFGSVGDALFFGLPGNPASTLVTFEIFVRPVLRKMAGQTQILRPQVGVTLAHPLPHEIGRREFVRARWEFVNGVCVAVPLGVQTSHRLASLAGADALLVAHESHGDYVAGDTLPALLLHA